MKKLDTHHTEYLRHLAHLIARDLSLIPADIALKKSSRKIKESPRRSQKKTNTSNPRY